MAGPAGVLARPRMRAQPGARPESARQGEAGDGTSRALWFRKIPGDPDARAHLGSGMVSVLR